MKRRLNFFTDNKNEIVSSNRILYTPSAFARTSLLHLQEIGILTAIKPHTSRRSNLSSYLFFMIKSGSGTLEYNGVRHTLTPGSCVFIDCKKPYAHTTDSDYLWTLHWCHFNGPSMASIYNKYCERGGRPVFTPEDSAPFFSVLSELTSVAKSTDYMRDMRINALLSELMVCIMSESWHPEDKALPNKRASVLDVKTYIDEHYNEQIVLDELASRSYISKYYLTHSFKDQFGMTINSYLQSVRITHAKQLLRFSDKTLEQISVEIGINDPAYFSRLFKNIEGVSPSVYREQW